MTTGERSNRVTAMHLLRSGRSPTEVAAEMKRCLSWVYKWRGRFASEGWRGLEDRSRAPIECPKQLPERVWQQIRAMRSQVEAEAEIPGQLPYIGAHAIRARLRKKRLKPLPSLSSIERELRRAGMTRPKAREDEPQIQYPHLQPGQAGQLLQIDIVPHYLLGGRAIACFNGIDVVSRYPAGQQYAHKRTQDALDFLLQAWQEVGLSDFTQLDNETCFSGGHTHPYVLGRVLRLGLWVGTEIVFSPFYHPKSNAFIERFHQDYNRAIWDRYVLADLVDVQQQSPGFFEAYRNSCHHSDLNGRSPVQQHAEFTGRQLPRDLQVPARLPLTAGHVHFMRRVDANRQIRLLNVQWDVLTAKPDQGVWATLTFRSSGAHLRVFSAAPDAARRAHLATHVFPLKEAVQPLLPQFQKPRPPLARLLWEAAANSLSAWVSSMF
jgi:transposase InsO family protein